jgi:hypothetical protein
MVIQGTFFGGEYFAIVRYHNEYWAAFRFMASQGWFVGLEQKVQAAIFVYGSPSAWLAGPQGEGKGCDPWLSFYATFGNWTKCFRSQPLVRRSEEKIVAE